MSYTLYFHHPTTRKPTSRTYRIQRDAAEFAAILAWDHPGSSVPIYNQNDVATTYVITNEAGTWHVRTDRHGYETNRTLIDPTTLLDLINPLCPDCGHPRSDHDDGEHPTEQENDR